MKKNTSWLRLQVSLYHRQIQIKQYLKLRLKWIYVKFDVYVGSTEERWMDWKDYYHHHNHHHQYRDHEHLIIIIVIWERLRGRWGERKKERAKERWGGWELVIIPWDTTWKDDFNVNVSFIMFIYTQNTYVWTTVSVPSIIECMTSKETSLLSHGVIFKTINSIGNPANIHPDIIATRNEK